MRRPCWIKGVLLADTEFRFLDGDFQLICELIYERAGIKLNDSKKPMVYSRLARRLRALGFATFSSYLGFLKSSPESDEWELFTNALTTNLTSFFRESHHFDILSERLPEWQQASGKVSIWCCASSTGEEPYSIMMTAVQCFASLNPPVSLLASDLDTNVLDKAKQGVYALERVSDMDESLRQRFFLRGKGSQAGLVKVRRELRDAINFKQINLLANSWPIDTKFDAIFCRNVMIYFDKPTQRTLLERFVRLLKPHGRLFVGHSENLQHVSDLWMPCGQTVYRLRMSL